MYTDPAGLFAGDPSDYAAVQAVATVTGVAASTVASVGAAIITGAYPIPAGEGSDITPKQCENDDECQSLYKQIDISVNGLQRRYRQIRENKGKIDPTTHQDQFKMRQVHLRKLLNTANARGCLLLN